MSQPSPAKAIGLLVHDDQRTEAEPFELL